MFELGSDTIASLGNLRSMEEIATLELGACFSALPIHLRIEITTLGN